MDLISKLLPSLSSANRAYSTLSILTSILALLSVACGFCLYKVSTRRDLLKDLASQAEIDEQKAKIIFLSTQNRAARAQVEVLHRKSLKIGTMEVRLIARGRNTAALTDRFGTYAGLLECSLERSGSERLRFSAEHFEVINEPHETEARAVFHFDGPDLSGKTINDLGFVQTVECHMTGSYGSYFTEKQLEYNIDLLLNGINLPLVRRWEARAVGKDSATAFGRFAVDQIDQPVFERYEALMVGERIKP